MSRQRDADLASLYPDRSLPISVARQFTDRLRDAIVTGAFPEGMRLLPSRELAARIGISRNAIVAAIDQLVAERYLIARVGSGTFVTKLGRQQIESPVRAVPELPHSATRFIDALAPITFPRGHTTLFRHGIPDLDAFPATTWNRLSRGYRDGPAWLSYAPYGGVRELREALAHHLRQFRGIVARPEDIIVTGGAQSALMLIAEVMIEPGDPVLVEDPCYGMGRAAFVARGAETIPVRVDDNGLDAALAPAARLASVTPSHQYPLGGVMSQGRRAALVDWARSHDAYIVEDDYDGEFAFSRSPLPALQGDDPQRVLYVGTFSKVLVPGMRLGYLVCPPHLSAAFRAARAVSSLGSPAVTQLTMAAFIAEGHFARHARQLNAVYRQRAERLTELLQPLSDLVRIGPSTGGMHVAISARQPIDDVELACAADALGISLYPLSVECIERADLTGFLLGLGMSPIESLPSAVDALTRLLRADRSEHAIVADVSPRSAASSFKGEFTSRVSAQSPP